MLANFCSSRSHDGEVTDVAGREAPIRRLGVQQRHLLSLYGSPSVCLYLQTQMSWSDSQLRCPISVQVELITLISLPVSHMKLTISFNLAAKSTSSQCLWHPYLGLQQWSGCRQNLSRNMADGVRPDPHIVLLISRQIFNPALSGPLSS